MTISEALAEIKTLTKRIATKRAFITAQVVRADFVTDPLAKDGGAPEVIARELQAVSDLEARHVAIRGAIQAANSKTELTIEGETRSIAQWLVWRREIAPGLRQFLGTTQNTIHALRQQVQNQRRKLADGTAADIPVSIISHWDESKLQARIEQVDTILGTLDGLLSLKNATITITV